MQVLGTLAAPLVGFGLQAKPVLFSRQDTFQRSTLAPPVPQFGVNAKWLLPLLFPLLAVACQPKPSVPPASTPVEKPTILTTHRVQVSKDLNTPLAQALTKKGLSDGTYLVQYTQLGADSPVSAEVYNLLGQPAGIKPIIFTAPTAPEDLLAALGEALTTTP